jgi:hypothetical protein
MERMDLDKVEVDWEAERGGGDGRGGEETKMVG